MPSVFWKISLRRFRPELTIGYLAMRLWARQNENSPVLPCKAYWAVKMQNFCHDSKKLVAGESLGPSYAMGNVIFGGLDYFFFSPSLDTKVILRAGNILADL